MSGTINFGNKNMPDIQHNIRRLYIIKIAKWFMLTMPILMLFYADMGFTTEQSFILKACYSISIVVFEIPSGYAADVWGRKITIVIGSVLGCAGFVIYSLLSGFYAFMMAEMILEQAQLLRELQHEKRYREEFVDQLLAAPRRIP